MVDCCVLGQKSFARRGVVCVSQVCEDNGRFTRCGVRDDAYAYLVRASFKSDGDHGDVALFELWKRFDAS